jgi:hypothetical protein
VTRYAVIDLTLDGDGCWPDLMEPAMKGRVKNLMNTEAIAMAVLSDGTPDGKPNVSFRINASDGNVYLFQTTWGRLHLAVRAIEARYGPPG